MIDYCRHAFLYIYVRLFGHTTKKQYHTADGSGAIDREELAPLLGQLGIWVSAKMEKEVFPRLDLDCSGDIRQEELATWLENVSCRKLGAHTQTYALLSATPVYDFAFLIRKYAGKLLIGFFLSVDTSFALFLFDSISFYP